MTALLDVIIVGAGTGGLGALRDVQKRTNNFVIINDGPWGTMCARSGCMPSTALIEAANAFRRTQRFAEFGLETLAVPLDASGRPEVDPETMKVATLPIFFVGDANGDVPAQHEASDEGHIAGLNAAMQSLERFERRTPLTIVFCDPNVALVGARVGALDAAETVVGDGSFATQGRARLMLRSVGTIGLYANRKDGMLLGAELCAPGGEHLAHLLALAIHRGSTVPELLRAPYYHPSLEEGVRSALRAVAAQLPGARAFELEG